MDESKADKGFFPGNYIKLLQSEDPDFVEKQKEEQKLPKPVMKKEFKARPQKAGSSYLDYVNNTFADKEQLTIHHRRQQMLERKAPTLDYEEKHAKEVLGAYNKFGIGNANPTKAVLRRTGYKMDKFQGKNVRLLVILRGP